MKIGCFGLWALARLTVWPVIHVRSGRAFDRKGFLFGSPRSGLLPISLGGGLEVDPLRGDKRYAGCFEHQGNYLCWAIPTGGQLHPHTPTRPGPSPRR